MTQLPAIVISHAPGLPLGTRSSAPSSPLERRACRSQSSPVRIRRTSARSPTMPRTSGTSRVRDVIAQLSSTLERADPEDVDRRPRAPPAVGFSVLFAAVFLLAAVLRRSQTVAPAPGQGRVGGLLRRARTRVHVLRDHDDPTTRCSFLGYPTYSLTVTLAAMLVSTGLGALPSRRFVDRASTAVPARPRTCSPRSRCSTRSRIATGTAPSLCQYRAHRARDRRRSCSCPRSACASACSCHSVSTASWRVTGTREEYVAWAWAVNGFFSVIGSVLTTMLAMTFGFREVQFGAVAI